jgi:ankyrin repeat protein
LLEAGADPDARSWENLSPLGHARDVAIARLLIEAGADVHLRRPSTLLHHRPTPELAQLFIDAGVDVNALDEAGQTPLDVAEMSRQGKLVAVLHANGGRSGKKRKP